MNVRCVMVGLSTTADMELPLAAYRVVSPDYFRGIEITLLRGCFFESRNTVDAPPLIIVNRRLAEHFWPGEDPTGKRMKIGPVDSPNPWDIVACVGGVVGRLGVSGE